MLYHWVPLNEQQDDAMEMKEFKALLKLCGFIVGQIDTKNVQFMIKA